MENMTLEQLEYKSKKVAHNILFFRSLLDDLEKEFKDITKERYKRLAKEPSLLKKGDENEGNT
jgi:hypothetical protein